MRLESWKERLSGIVNGYGINDIWNMEETGKHRQKVDLGKKENLVMEVRKASKG